MHRDSMYVEGGDKLTFGERLKKIRQEKGMSQRELGEILGVTQQTIAQYEKIKETPKAETLLRLANALGVSIYELRGETVSFALYSEKAKSGNLALTDLFDMWLLANEIEWKRAQRYGKQGREFTLKDFAEESYFVTESQFKIIRKGNIEYVKSRIREFDESNKDSQD